MTETQVQSIIERQELYGAAEFVFIKYSAIPVLFLICFLI